MVEWSGVSSVVFGDESIHHPFPLGWHSSSFTIGFLGSFDSNGSSELVEDFQPARIYFFLQFAWRTVWYIERQDVKLLVIFLPGVSVLWPQKGNNGCSSTNHVVSVLVRMGTEVTDTGDATEWPSLS